MRSGHRANAVPPKSSKGLSDWQYAIIAFFLLLLVAGIVFGIGVAIYLSAWANTHSS